MVTDKIENAASYVNLGSRIATALGFVSRHDLADMPLGRHDIERDTIFALVQEYETRPAEGKFWETHRKYIDVQFVQSGIEAMAWAPCQTMKLKKDYDPEKELTMWEGHGQSIQLPAGWFAIFMPHDAHMGGLQIDRSVQVRKIVVKVAVE